MGETYILYWSRFTVAIQLYCLCLVLYYIDLYVVQYRTKHNIENLLNVYIISLQERWMD